MIIPAILEQSIDEVQKKVDRVNGFVDRIQVDIIDNHQTVNIEDLQKINFYDLAIDIHLMTDNPEQFLGQCSRLVIARIPSPPRETWQSHENRSPRGQKPLAMTNDVRIIGQIERMTDQKQFIKKAHQTGFRAGLALDLYTPISALDVSAKKEADCILLMSVKAGIAAQQFHHHILEKISELKSSPYAGAIVMDGGEDPLHIKMSKHVGATEFAVGNYLWQHDNIRIAFENLKEVVNSGTN